VAPRKSRKSCNSCKAEFARRCTPCHRSSRAIFHSYQLTRMSIKTRLGNLVYSDMKKCNLASQFFFDRPQKLSTESGIPDSCHSIRHINKCTDLLLRHNFHFVVLNRIGLHWGQPRTGEASHWKQPHWDSLALGKQPRTGDSLTGDSLVLGTSLLNVQTTVLDYCIGNFSALILHELKARFWPI
jgi:hypothetical protein